MLAIEFVRPAGMRREHVLGECVSRGGLPNGVQAGAIRDDAACAKRCLVGDPEWEPVLEAVGRFADALVQRPASKSRFQR